MPVLKQNESMNLLKTQQNRHVLVGFFSSQVFQLASLSLNCIATFTCSSFHIWPPFEQHGCQKRSRYATLSHNLLSESSFSLHQGDCAGQHRYGHLEWRQYKGGLPEQPQHRPGGGWERTIRTSLQGAAPR